MLRSLLWLQTGVSMAVLSLQGAVCHSQEGSQLCSFLRGTGEGQQGEGAGEVAGVDEGVRAT